MVVDAEAAAAGVALGFVVGRDGGARTNATTTTTTTTRVVDDEAKEQWPSLPTSGAAFAAKLRAAANETATESSSSAAAKRGRGGKKKKAQVNKDVEVVKSHPITAFFGPSATAAGEAADAAAQSSSAAAKQSTGGKRRGGGRRRVSPGGVPMRPITTFLGRDVAKMSDQEFAARLKEAADADADAAVEEDAENNDVIDLVDDVVIERIVDDLSRLPTREELEDVARALGLEGVVVEAVPVEGDGNCLPRAVVVAMGREETSHSALRADAARFVAESTDQFWIDAFANADEAQARDGGRVRTKADFVRRLGTDRAWCGELDIHAIARSAGIRIHVFTRSSTTGTTMRHTIGCLVGEDGAAGARTDVAVWYDPTPGHYTALVVGGGGAAATAGGGAGAVAGGGAAVDAAAAVNEAAVNEAAGAVADEAADEAAGADAAAARHADEAAAVGEAAGDVGVEETCQCARDAVTFVDANGFEATTTLPNTVDQIKSKKFVELGSEALTVVKSRSAKGAVTVSLTGIPFVTDDRGRISSFAGGPAFIIAPGRTNGNRYKSIKFGVRPPAGAVCKQVDPFNLDRLDRLRSAVERFVAHIFASDNCTMREKERAVKDYLGAGQGRVEFKYEDLCALPTGSKCERVDAAPRNHARADTPTIELRGSKAKILDDDMVFYVKKTAKLRDARGDPYCVEAGGQRFVDVNDVLGTNLPNVTVGGASDPKRHCRKFIFQMGTVRRLAGGQKKWYPHPLHDFEGLKVIVEREIEKKLREGLPLSERYNLVRLDNLTAYQNFTRECQDQQTFHRCGLEMDAEGNISVSWPPVLQVTPDALDQAIPLSNQNLLGVRVTGLRFRKEGASRVLGGNCSDAKWYFKCRTSGEIQTFSGCELREACEALGKDTTEWMKASLNDPARRNHAERVYARIVRASLGQSNSSLRILEVGNLVTRSYLYRAYRRILVEACIRKNATGGRFNFEDALAEKRLRRTDAEGFRHVDALFGDGGVQGFVDASFEKLSCEFLDGRSVETDKRLRIVRLLHVDEIIPVTAWDHTHDWDTRLCWHGSNGQFLPGKLNMRKSAKYFSVEMEAYEARMADKLGVDEEYVEEARETRVCRVNPVGRRRSDGYDIFQDPGGEHAREFKEKSCAILDGVDATGAFDDDDDDAVSDWSDLSDDDDDDDDESLER